MKNLLTFSCALFLGATTASASTVASRWYHGSWSCNIDGRAARMVWRVVDDPQTTCHDGICTSTSGVKVVGRFSDSGGPWVALEQVGNSGSTFRFRYTGDRTIWQLTHDAQTGIATGNTVWQGRRYPLSCRDRR